MAVLAPTASSQLRSWRAPHENKAPRDGRRPATGDLMLAVFRRRNADVFFEPRAERAEAREPDEIADLGDGQIRGAEQLPRPLDAPLRKVCARRSAIGVAKRAHEMETRIPGLAADRAKTRPLELRPVHEVLRRAEVQEPLDVRRGRD